VLFQQWQVSVQCCGLLANIERFGKLSCCAS